MGCQVFEEMCHVGQQSPVISMNWSCSTSGWSAKSHKFAQKSCGKLIGIIMAVFSFCHQPNIFHLPDLESNINSRLPENTIFRQRCLHTQPCSVGQSFLAGSLNILCLSPSNQPWSSPWTNLAVLCTVSLNAAQ